MTNLGQDDNWVCSHMLRDFDVCLTFDLDIGVNGKFSGYIFYASQKSEFYLFQIKWEVASFSTQESKGYGWSCSEQFVVNFECFTIHKVTQC